MIQSNPAKVNFTKVFFTFPNKKLKYFYDYLEINDSNYKMISKTKITYVKELYINYSPEINKYNKLQISKVDLISIYLKENKNINYFIDLIIQLNPKYSFLKLDSSLTIPYLRFPKNICFTFNIDIYKLKTIVYCDEINFHLYFYDMNFTILQLNLNFINTNLKYFKFKKMSFTFMNFLERKNEKEYEIFIKNILKPYSNIKFYNIKLSNMIKEYIASLTKN